MQNTVRYMQILAYFTDIIDAGKMQEGDQMPTENEIDIPQVVCTVENKRVWHMSKADFRHIGVLKCLEKLILR